MNDEKITLYRLLLPRLTDFERENWKDTFTIEFTHHSTAIEGNTLTMIETKMILDDGIVPKETELRELNEIIGHANAWEYVQEHAYARHPITEETIKDIHQLTLPVPGIGGLYRTVPVYIRGASHVPPSPYRVREDMTFFAQDLQGKKFSSTIERAAWTHAEFVKIHPFQDGNGRTSRLLMNYQLLFDDYPPVCIKSETTEEYFYSLDVYATTGNLLPFQKLLEENLERDLDKFLSMYVSQHFSKDELMQKDKSFKLLEAARPFLYEETEAHIDLSR